MPGLANPPEGILRILVADDHTPLREGLKQLLSGAGFQVVGEAQDGDEALERVWALDFDVLVLDLSMPGLNGVGLVKAVRRASPALRVLALSMHREHEYADRALRAGADGYLIKDNSSRSLLEAVRAIGARRPFRDPDLSAPVDGALPRLPTRTSRNASC